MPRRIFSVEPAPSLETNLPVVINVVLPKVPDETNQWQLQESYDLKGWRTFPQKYQGKQQGSLPFEFTNSVGFYRWVRVNN